MTRFLTQLNNSHLITLPQKEKKPNKTKPKKQQQCTVFFKEKTKSITRRDQKQF